MHLLQLHCRSVTNFSKINNADYVANQINETAMTAIFSVNCLISMHIINCIHELFGLICVFYCSFLIFFSTGQLLVHVMPCCTIHFAS